MKKQVNKLSIKTDKIVSLTKDQTNGLMGGRPSSNVESKHACCTDAETTLTLTKLTK